MISFMKLHLSLITLFCIFDCVSSKIWLIGAILRCNCYLIFIVVSDYLRINVKSFSNELV